jgi:predicted RNA-binding Zn-ribbon protein involved in translation (DUF1610 family)
MKVFEQRNEKCTSCSSRVFKYLNDDNVDFCCHKCGIIRLKESNTSEGEKRKIIQKVINDGFGNFDKKEDYVFPIEEYKKTYSHIMIVLNESDLTDSESIELMWQALANMYRQKLKDPKDVDFYKKDAQYCFEMFFERLFKRD